MHRILAICILVGSTAMAQVLPGTYTNPQNRKNYRFTLKTEEPNGMVFGIMFTARTNGEPVHINILVDDQSVLSYSMDTIRIHPESSAYTYAVPAHVPGPFPAGKEFQIQCHLSGNFVKILHLNAYSISYDPTLVVDSLTQQAQQLSTQIDELSLNRSKNAENILALQSQIQSIQTQLDPILKRQQSIEANINRNMKGISTNSRKIGELGNQINDFNKEIQLQMDSLKIQKGLLNRVEDKKYQGALTEGFPNFKNSTPSNCQASSSRISNLPKESRLLNKRKPFPYWIPIATGIGGAAVVGTGWLLYEHGEDQRMVEWEEGRP